MNNSHRNNRPRRGKKSPEETAREYIEQNKDPGYIKKVYIDDIIGI